MAPSCRSFAARWQVSQAEVVRRAVAQAESQPEPQTTDPVAMLGQLLETGQGLDPKKAESYLAQVYADRKRWRAK